MDISNEEYLSNLRKEYNDIKSLLSKWKQDFIDKYQREPTIDDIQNSMDEETQQLMLRKEELNIIIAENKTRRKSKYIYIYICILFS